MDPITEQTLRLFQSHHRIRNFLTLCCYFLIIGGLFIYIFYAFNHSRAAKLVLKYKENADEMKTEKIMTNPRVDFEYEDKQIYHIKAKTAWHKDNQNAILQNVSAEGNMGNITAGELQISESGDHLVFTKNPVLILNKIEVKK